MESLIIIDGADKYISIFLFLSILLMLSLVGLVISSRGLDDKKGGS